MAVIKDISFHMTGTGKTPCRSWVLVLEQKDLMRLAKGFQTDSILGISTRVSSELRATYRNGADLGATGIWDDARLLMYFAVASARPENATYHDFMEFVQQAAQWWGIAVETLP